MPTTDPAKLYHYTTSDGLLGIVGSHSLWATDIQYLNDKREFEYAAGVAADLIQARADLLMHDEEFEPENPDHSRAAVLNGIAARIRDVQTNGHEYYYAYVTCFCEHDDLLSQWRGYSSDQGYALGFDRTGLESGQVRPNSNTRLVKVEYGSDNKKETLASLLSRLGTYPTGHPGVTAETEFGEIAMPTLSTIKHPGFREEAEWRLITTMQAESTSFRRGKFAITPYISIDFDPSILREIVVGPGDNQALGEQAVRRLIDSTQGLAHVSVRVSDIPFRP